MLEESFPVWGDVNEPFCPLFVSVMLLSVSGVGVGSGFGVGVGCSGFGVGVGCSGWIVMFSPEFTVLPFTTMLLLVVFVTVTPSGTVSVLFSGATWILIVSPDFNACTAASKLALPITVFAWPLLSTEATYSAEEVSTFSPKAVWNTPPVTATGAVLSELTSPVTVPLAILILLIFWAVTFPLIVAPSITIFAGVFSLPW